MILQWRAEEILYIEILSEKYLHNAKPEAKRKRENENYLNFEDVRMYCKYKKSILKLCSC